MKLRKRALTAALAGASLFAALPSTAAAAPTCHGRAATIVGTGDADVLRGTDRDDVIVAAGGDDVVLAGDGSDAVCAGPGEDTVYGGGGPDRLFGGADDDILVGGPGDDRLHGDAGFDVALFPRSHSVRADLQDGTAVGSGSDLLRGVEGLVGGPGDDMLFGDAGGNLIVGGAGHDRLSGREGDDVLFGGAGRDALVGGEGSDFVSGGRDADEIAAGDGYWLDTVSYAHAQAGVWVDLDGGRGLSIEDNQAVEDRLRGVEAVVGSGHHDRVIGNADPNSFRGGRGRDTLLGYGSDDYLDGEEGADVARGWRGRDVCFAETVSGCEITGRGALGAPAAVTEPQAPRITPLRATRVSGSVGTADVGPATCRVTAGAAPTLTVQAPQAVEPAPGRSRQVVWWDPIVYRWDGHRWRVWESRRWHRKTAVSTAVSSRSKPLGGLTHPGGALTVGVGNRWIRAADGARASRLRFASPPENSYFAVVHYLEWTGTGHAFVEGPMWTIHVREDGEPTGYPSFAAWCRS